METVFKKMSVAAMLALLTWVPMCFANIAVPSFMLNGFGFLLLLIPILLIELHVFQGIINGFKLRYLVWANLVSTVLGLPLAWFLMAGVATVSGDRGWSLLAFFDGTPRWIILLGSFLHLLISFLLSVLVEYIFLKGVLGNKRRKLKLDQLKKATWIANASSYLFLILLQMIFLTALLN